MRPDGGDAGIRKVRALGADEGYGEGQRDRHTAESQLVHAAAKMMSVFIFVPLCAVRLSCRENDRLQFGKQVGTNFQHAVNEAAPIDGRQPFGRDPVVEHGPPVHPSRMPRRIVDAVVVPPVRRQPLG